LLTAAQDHKNLINAHTAIGIAQKRQGRWREALSSLQTALQFAGNLGSPARQLEILAHVADGLRFAGTQHGFAMAQGLLAWIVDAQHPALEPPVEVFANTLLAELGTSVVETWQGDLAQVCARVEQIFDELK
jgi:hypothetical protein